MKTFFRWVAPLKALLALEVAPFWVSPFGMAQSNIQTSGLSVGQGRKGAREKPPSRRQARRRARVARRLLWAQSASRISFISGVAKSKADRPLGPIAMKSAS